MEAAQVLLRIARVGGAVGDNGETLAQGGGKFLEERIHAGAKRGGGENLWNPLLLPLAYSRPGNKTKSEPMPPPTDVAAVHEPPARAVLVVDDDVDVLRFLRDTLTAFTHCRVDTSPSPEYAFELAIRKAYDLFLFDFSMPIMDGAVLYGMIRKVHDFGVLTPPRPLPPLVLMSGHGEKQRARELLTEPGVRGLLPKPFSIERLLTKLEGSLPGVTRRPV